MINRAGAFGAGRGSSFGRGVAEVLALSFPNSLGEHGRVESRVRAEVPSVSRLVTDSEARVGGGVAAHGGHATALLGDWTSLSASRGGRGDRIDELVCGVTMTSLHKEK